MARTGASYALSTILWKKSNFICLKDYFEALLNKGADEGFGPEEVDGASHIFRTISSSLLKKLFHCQELTVAYAVYYPVEDTIYIQNLTLSYGENVRTAELKYYPTNTTINLYPSKTISSSSFQGGDFPTVSQLYLHLEIDLPESYGFVSFDFLDKTSGYSSTQYPYYKYKLNNISYYKRYNGEVLSRLMTVSGATDFSLMQDISYLFLVNGSPQENLINTVGTSENAQLYKIWNGPSSVSGWPDWIKGKDLIGDNSIYGYRVNNRNYYVNGYSTPGTTEVNVKYRSDKELYPKKGSGSVTEQQRHYWGFSKYNSFILDSNWGTNSWAIGGSTLNCTIKVRNNLVEVKRGSVIKYYPFDIVSNLIFIRRTPVEESRYSVIHRPIYWDINNSTQALYLDLDIKTETIDLTSLQNSLSRAIANAGYSYTLESVVEMTNIRDTYNFNKIGKYRCIGKRSGSSGFYCLVSGDKPSTVYFYFNYNQTKKIWTATLYYDARDEEEDEKLLKIEDITNENDRNQHESVPGFLSKPVIDFDLKFMKFDYGKEVPHYHITYGYELQFYKISLLEYPTLSYSDDSINLNGNDIAWDRLPWDNGGSWKNKIGDKFFEYKNTDFNLTIPNGFRCYKSSNYVADYSYATRDFGNTSSKFNMAIGSRVCIHTKNLPTLNDTSTPKFSSSSILPNLFYQTSSKFNISVGSSVTTPKTFIANWMEIEATMTTPGVLPSFIGLGNKNQVEYTINRTDTGSSWKVYSPVAAYNNGVYGLFSIWYDINSPKHAITLWGGRHTGRTLQIIDKTTGFSNNFPNGTTTRTVDVLFPNTQYTDVSKYVYNNSSIEFTCETSGAYIVTSSKISNYRYEYGRLTATLEATVTNWGTDPINLMASFKLYIKDPGELYV